MELVGVLTDTELLALIKGGDRPAFELIYQRYSALLYIHARKLLRDNDEAKDIVQEVFSTLWQKAEQIQLSSSLSAYLYASVRNRIFDLIRHKKIKSDYLISLQKFVRDGEYFIDDLIREKELANIIEAEIALLPPRMREIFELSRKQNLSYKEIAAQLEISDKTVKKQISNALTILRMKLNVSAGLLIILLHR